MNFEYEQSLLFNSATNEYKKIEFLTPNEINLCLDTWNQKISKVFDSKKSYNTESKIEYKQK